VPFDIVLIRIRDTSSDNNYDNTRVIRVGLQEARVDQNFRLLEPRLGDNMTLAVLRSEDIYARPANFARENFTKELNVTFL